MPHSLHRAVHPASHTATRREFLTTASLAAAGTLLGARRLAAETVQWLPIHSQLPANAFVSSTITASDLSALASRAVDAATHAGAGYADVRVSERNTLNPDFGLGEILCRMSTSASYGVRAMVDGVWGFAYGRVLTPDAVAQCAQDATAAAQLAARSAKGSPRSETAWVPAPAVTGEWRTPVAIDPFAVPLQQQNEVLTALFMTMARVPTVNGSVKMTWTRETRVIATSTGSLVTQYLASAEPEIEAQIMNGSNWVRLQVPGLHGAATGFELLCGAALLERAKIAAEEANELAQLPMGILDVGRYPVVFDGTTMGSTLLHLVGPALELDRVLGDEVEGAGTSLWTIDRLGTPVVSPLMTVTGTRALPSITAVQWDDEGTVPQVHTVIQDGRLMDYHTDGRTVSALQKWYQQHDRPLRSNGCASASEAHRAVMVEAPHLTMTPGTAQQSLNDLCAGIKHGVLVRDANFLQTDQQLASGSLSAGGAPIQGGRGYVHGGELFEVAQGKPVRKILYNTLQFNTLPFLKGLAAVGDSSTVHSQVFVVEKGYPWQAARHSASAPAALFKEVNVITTAH